MFALRDIDTKKLLVSTNMFCSKYVGTCDSFKGIKRKSKYKIILESQESRFLGIFIYIHIPDLNRVINTYILQRVNENI